MYQALYRKHRPNMSYEVVGQDHTIGTLKNQIITNQINHAYLLCGTRGTGKTTTGRWFAKAINCEHPVDGDPCGKCKSCISIAEGRNTDVLEIDAASNNGVESIKKIKDSAQYPPTMAKYKVYIMDESHMITDAGSNSFLKMLEEPPAHVVFIFATTDPLKVLTTIRSRCQIFEFRRIKDTVIVSRMKDIAKIEGFDIEDEALQLVAKMACGGMRDALSDLEKLVTSKHTGTITHEMAMSILGIVEDETLFKMTEDIANNNVEGILQNFQDVYESGKEMCTFVEQLITHYRNVLVVKLTKKTDMLVDLSAENRERVLVFTEFIVESQITAIIKKLSKLLKDASKAQDSKTIIEVGLLEIAEPLIDPTIDNLVAEIKILRQQVQELLSLKEAAVTSEVKSEKETVVTSEVKSEGVEKDVETLEPSNEKLSLEQLNFKKTMQILLDNGYDEVAEIIKDAKVVKVSEDTLSLFVNDVKKVYAFLSATSSKCKVQNIKLLRRAIELGFGFNFKIVLQ